MTPEQEDLVMALVVAPGGSEPMAAADFLEAFGAPDGLVLGLDLLRDAVARRDPDSVELSLIVCFNFGFSLDHLDPLVALAFADWHERHEDVASALGRLRSPAAVAPLLHLAEWVPAYLAFDDARALATKAIWALGSIADDASVEALERLVGSDEPIVAEGAKAQLEK